MYLKESKNLRVRWFQGNAEIFKQKILRIPLKYHDFQSNVQ